MQNKSRSFKIIRIGKSYPKYSLATRVFKGTSPVKAARKIGDYLCKRYEFTSIPIIIRETTRGSKKMTFGPYITQQQQS